MCELLLPRAICALVCAAISLTAYTHDMWLFPRNIPDAPGDNLVVSQVIGAELIEDMEIELLQGMTSRYELITTDSTMHLLKEIRDPRRVIQPVLDVPVRSEGQYLVVMDHHFIYDQHSNQKFLEYLDHEHLDRDLFREGMGERAHQSERYARTMKSLVQVGKNRGSDLHKRETGQTLEILLLQNPFLLEPGDSLEVQVLFKGEPLKEKLVSAMCRGESDLLSKQDIVTDANGVARFVLDCTGLWLVRLVHLYPCEDPYTDWESFWSSFSFVLH